MSHRTPEVERFQTLESFGEKTRLQQEKRSGSTGGQGATDFAAPGMEHGGRVAEFEGGCVRHNVGMFACGPMLTKRKSIRGSS